MNTMLGTTPKLYCAGILADSISPSGVRLTTMVVTMPRIVLAEFNTHRVFSRNSASSRAIPVEKRIKMVEDDPFIPLSFGSNQKGMQAGAALDGEDAEWAQSDWIGALRDAIKWAKSLARRGVHKQIANRLLEPFCPHTVIVTSTEWANFFALRCHPAAQPEIRLCAEAMRSALHSSVPTPKRPGEWHLPLINDGDDKQLELDQQIKLSVARCARVSYLTHDGKRDPKADLELYYRLRDSGHMSPMEHAATPIPKPHWCGNFRGWMQHRKEIPNEAVFSPKRADG